MSGSYINGSPYAVQCRSAAALPRNHTGPGTLTAPHRTAPHRTAPHGRRHAQDQDQDQDRHVHRHELPRRPTLLPPAVRRVRLPLLGAAPRREGPGRGVQEDPGHAAGARQRRPPGRAAAHGPRVHVGDLLQPRVRAGARRHLLPQLHPVRRQRRPRHHLRAVRGRRDAGLPHPPQVRRAAGLVQPDGQLRHRVRDGERGGAHPAHGRDHPALAALALRPRRLPGARLPRHRHARPHEGTLQQPAVRDPGRDAGRVPAEPAERRREQVLQRQLADPVRGHLSQRGLHLLRRVPRLHGRPAAGRGPRDPGGVRRRGPVAPRGRNTLGGGEGRRPPTTHLD